MSSPETTSELIAYYEALLPAQYVTQPNAVATIGVLAELALMPQGGNYLTDSTFTPLTDVLGNLLTDAPIDPILPLALLNAFNVTTAVGQQLQYLAELVGCKDSGYNLSGQFVTLSDSDFSLLIQAKGAYNRLRGTTALINNFIAQYFSGILRVSDDLNMKMTYTLLVPLNSLQWVELFITQNLLPKPLGVNMGTIIYPSGVYFGFCTYWADAPSWVAPMCTYSSPVTAPTHPMLLYSDSIEV